jgi:PAS domain S-box-containing protein
MKQQQVTITTTELAEIKKAKSYAESLIETMVDGLWVIDERGKTIDVNQAMAKMLGYKNKSELIKKKPADITCKESLDETQRTVKASLAGKTSAGIINVIKTNGGKLTVSLKASPRKNPQGRIIGGFAILRDITKEKETEKILQQQKLSLEQKNLALTEIVEHIERAKNKMKDDIACNVSELLMPVLEKLKRAGISSKYLNLLQHHLENLTSSFGKEITAKNIKLTPKEIEICHLIKGNLSSKEIAKLLQVSQHTVEKHRKDIRKKIGITNKNINLTSYLREKEN